MTETTKRYVSTGGMLAVGLIFAGALMLLGNFGVFGPQIEIWDFWPVIFIFAGIGLILQSHDYLYYFDGMMLMLIGVIILNENIHVVHWRHLGWDLIWPVLLVYSGIRILIFGTMQRHFFDTKVLFNSEDFHIVALFGGGEYRYDNKKLKDGKILAVFGGCKVDLRSADIEGEEIHLNCVAMFGGIELLVPRNWSVMVNGLPIFGGFGNKTQLDASVLPQKRMTITGIAMMGGIDIKN